MKYLAPLAAVVATPAAAHHEVTMIASLLPVMPGVVVVVSGIAFAVWRTLRRK